MSSQSPSLFSSSAAFDIAVYDFQGAARAAAAPSAPSTLAPCVPFEDDVYCNFFLRLSCVPHDQLFSIPLRSDRI